MWVNSEAWCFNETNIVMCIEEDLKEHSLKQTEIDKQQNWNDLVKQILWLLQGQMQAHVPYLKSDNYDYFKMTYNDKLLFQ